MADCSVSEACSLCISNIQTSIIPRDKCRNCEGLKSELYKAQLEILYYEKVIQVLRNELYHVEPRAQPEHRNRTVHHDEQHRSHTQRTTGLWLFPSVASARDFQDGADL